MNASDLARLHLAKRAYQAAQPSSTEVQRGVRRARLWLRRPKPRRAWFSKGLVLVVLALGSLAYAKPQAIAELLERGGPSSIRSQEGRQASATAERQNEEEPNRHEALPPKTLVVPMTSSAEVASAPAPYVASGPTPAPALPAVGTSGSKSKRLVSSSVAATAAPPGTSAGSGPAGGSSEAPTDAALSEWGRVGQALARGDEARALRALNELSGSDDQRTRNKADLGRAQLLMSHGEGGQACSLARSLMQRRAGSHIERQALLLLKSCPQ